jgi:hypothetical protein
MFSGTSEVVIGVIWAGGGLDGLLVGEIALSLVS